MSASTPNKPASYLERESILLAPYATHSAHTAGRKHLEPPHPYRGPFQRDRDRIVHSAAYRRLSAKTQVFTGELGDYHRTRLTHTHEVASVARTLARALALNEDLVEALALVHDLGHPPFGHAGEDVLDDCLKASGGFNHNAQALRIVEFLEIRYPEFPGLNLSREVLAGQQYRVQKDVASALRPSLEVQAVDAADSVAYDTHDADDALELKLLTLDELLENTLWSEAERRVRLRYANLEGSDLRRAMLHELIDWQVGDLLEQAVERLDEFEAVPAAEMASLIEQSATIIRPSDELAEQKAELESFLFDRVYRHPEVLAHRTEAQAFLREMFENFARNPDLLPESFRSRIANAGLDRSVGDYLAGMTDRFARREYDRIGKRRQAPFSP